MSQDWSPRPAAHAGDSIAGGQAGSRRQALGRPGQGPSRLAGRGTTLLRASGKDEILCRCDSGSRGYFSIAVHAHSLSVEVRYAGVDILANPGAFRCYAERVWRSYFRSTIAHNTVELGGRSQPAAHGLFMGKRRTLARQIEVLDDGDIARWTAEHDGYACLDPSALHRRSVLLDRASRSVDIIDQIDGGSHDIRLGFHLGPDIEADLEESCAVLNWPTASTPGAARLELPPALRWSLHRGETDPILGWYSRGFRRRVPAITLLGCGHCVPGIPLISRLEFLEVGKSGKSAHSWQARSWSPSATRSDRGPESQAEAR